MGERVMQGYLTPNRLDLTIRQNRHYFHSLCGLCQQLKQDYGSVARFLVNRDALILQLLTEAQLSQQPPSQKIRCGVQPLLHSATANPKAAKFAAAVTVMMFWGKLTDTIQDAKGFFGFFSRSVAKFILWKYRHKIKKAENVLRELDFDVQVIYDLFEQQQKLEQSAEFSSLDEAAEPTAHGLAALFAHTAILANCLENIDSLKRLGKEVGAMLYILDARDDLSKDIKQKHFNPLSKVFDAEDKATYFLYQKHQLVNEQFLSLKICYHQEVLGNIFDLGLQKYLEQRKKTCCTRKNLEKESILKMRLAGDCCVPDCGGCDSSCEDGAGEGCCNCSFEYCANVCCDMPCSSESNKSNRDKRMDSCYDCYCCNNPCEDFCDKTCAGFIKKLIN